MNHLYIFAPRSTGFTEELSLPKEDISCFKKNCVLGDYQLIIHLKNTNSESDLIISNISSEIYFRQSKDFTKKEFKNLCEFKKIKNIFLIHILTMWQKTDNLDMEIMFISKPKLKDNLEILNRLREKSVI